MKTNNEHDAFTENQRYTTGYIYLDSYGILHYTPSLPNAGRDGRVPKSLRVDDLPGYAGYITNENEKAVKCLFNRETQKFECECDDVSARLAQAYALTLAKTEGWLIG